MSEIEILIIGAGNTAKNIGLFIEQNSEALKKEVILTFANPNDQKKNSNRAELAAREINQAGILLGKDYGVEFLHGKPDDAVARKPDIAVLALGRQRKPGESRSDLFGDNSMAVFDAVADYCPRNKIDLSDSFTVGVGNPVGSLGHVECKALQKIVHETHKLNPKKIVAVGTGADETRAIELINYGIKNNPGLSKKYCLKDIIFNAGAGHDNGVVFTEEYGTIGGKPINKVLGKETVEKICKRVKGMGAEYNNYGGAGPIVGADVYRNAIKPFVNNELENVPLLAPVKISDDSELYRLGLNRNNILGHAFEYTQKENDEKFWREEFEGILPEIDHVWTGLRPKVGEKGVTGLAIPEYSDLEMQKFEKSIGMTIIETAFAYREGGVLRPYFNP